MRQQNKLFEQKKIVARRRKRAWFLTLFAVAAAGIFISALSFIANWNALTIDRVIIEGNKLLPSYEAESIALDHISGNYLFLFSRANALLYPKSAIRDSIADLPLVRDVRVSRRGLGTIIVSITEREEVARFCEGSTGDVSSCFSLDEKGFAFAPQTNDGGFIYRGPLTERQFHTPADFKQYQFFIRELEGLSVEPREALIPENGPMTITLAAGGEIIIFSKDNLSTILANIASVINDKTVAPSFSEFLRNLDYMKFDEGNKVVYKMKR